MYVAVMGYGTVGSGVVEVLTKNHDSIVKKSIQDDIKIKYILDLLDFAEDPNADKFVKDFNIILNDDEVKVVVETMGGVKPAFDFVLACLNKGKSVVTSNKELVATKGLELLDAARKNNANFLFEASVGGGIPIIRPISQCLAANEIEAITGILNGTTNFILAKMIKDKMSFEEALKLAQDNGYAEKDPTADIEGFDASRKICILSSLCFGKHVYPDAVHTEGITKVTLEDIAYAQSFNSVIKLIATSKMLGKQFKPACRC
ncbi:MAG: homoserine dehydrogenase [Oscillospiraceae bacterium]